MSAAPPPAHPGLWWLPAVAAARPARPAASALPFVALMTFTVVLIAAPQTWVPGLAAIRPALLAAAAAAVFHVYTSLGEGRPVTSFDRPLVLALLLAGWAVVTVPLSIWPGGSVALLRDLFFKALIVFWLLGAVVNTRSRLRRAAWTFVLLMIPLSVTAVSHFREGTYTPGSSLNRIAGYEAPLTENPNDLALMLNLGIPVTLGLAAQSPPSVLRVLLFGAAALSGLAVLLTYSRTGFLCLAVIGLVYLAKLARRGRAGALVFALLVAIAIVPFVPRRYVERISTAVDVQEDPTGSAQTRLADLRVASRVALEHPLVGAGAGMNMLALNEARGPGWSEVHNVYLQYAVDLGWPGLILFLALWATCVRTAARVRREAEADADAADFRHLAEGLQVSLIAFAVAAFFHPVAYHFYFFYVGGLAVAAGRVWAAHREAA